MHVRVCCTACFFAFAADVQFLWTKIFTRLCCVLQVMGAVTMRKTAITWTYTSFAEMVQSWGHTATFVCLFVCMCVCDKSCIPLSAGLCELILATMRSGFLQAVCFFFLPQRFSAASSVFSSFFEGSFPSLSFFSSAFVITPFLRRHSSLPFIS